MASKASQPTLNIHDFPLELQKILVEYDDEGNGILEMDEIAEVFTSYKKMKEDQAEGVLRLTNLPTPKFRELAAVFDANGNGTIEPFEFQRAVEMYQASQKRVKNLKKIVVAAACFVLILLFALLGVVFVAVELSKEAKVESDGAMRAAGTDQVIKVNSAESFVDDTGKTRTSSGAEMTTTIATTSVALKYSTPIEVLNRMKTISVAEPTFSAVGQVVGAYKVAQKMVLGTKYFKIIMTQDKRTFVVPEDDDLLTSSSEFIAPDETTRKLLGVTLSPGRKLLEATNTVTGHASDQIINDLVGLFPKMVSDAWIEQRYFIPMPAEPNVYTCFHRVMVQMSYGKCAEPNYDPQSPEEHVNVFGFKSTQGGGECYCIPSGGLYNLAREPQNKHVTKKDGWAIYSYDPDLYTGKGIEERKERRGEFLQTYSMATVNTPIPASPYIQLVAVGEFCNNLKMLQGPIYKPNPNSKAGGVWYQSRGIHPDNYEGWFVPVTGSLNEKDTKEWQKIAKTPMTVDDCMDLALATEECMAHGPTIQFHDYGSFPVNNFGEYATNSYENYNFMDPSIRCSCSYSCEGDKIDPKTSTLSSFGDCKGMMIALKPEREGGYQSRPLPEKQGFNTKGTNTYRTGWLYGGRAGIDNYGAGRAGFVKGGEIGHDCRVYDHRLGYTEWQIKAQTKYAEFKGLNTNVYTYTGPKPPEPGCARFTMAPSGGGIVTPFGPDVMNERYHCPKELSKDNWKTFIEGSMDNDAKFHVMVDSSSAEGRTIKVVRTSGTGAWNYDLVFDCCEVGSGFLKDQSAVERLELEVDVILPPNPTGEGKYFTLPPGRNYICAKSVWGGYGTRGLDASAEPPCTKELCFTTGWIGGYERDWNRRGGNLVVVPISDNVWQVNRRGSVCESVGWDFDLHFICIDDGPSQNPVPVARDSSPTCKCTTPGQGTVGRNQYTCSDTGTVGNCADHEECFATELFKEGLEASACRPKATCRCETPQQGTAGRNKVVCDGMGDNYCFADQECYRHDSFMFGDFSQTACRVPGESAKSVEEPRSNLKDSICTTVVASNSDTKTKVPNHHLVGCPNLEIVDHTNWLRGGGSSDVKFQIQYHEIEDMYHKIRDTYISLKLYSGAAPTNDWGYDVAFECCQPTCRSFFATESGTEKILPEGYHCPSIVQSTNWFDAPEDPTVTFTTTNEGISTVNGETGNKWTVRREDIKFTYGNWGKYGKRTDKPWPEEFKLGFWCCTEKIVMNFGTSTQQDTKPVIGSMNFVVHPEDKDLPHPYPTDRYECPAAVNRDTSDRQVFDNLDLFYLTETSPWRTIERLGLPQLRKEYSVQKIQQDGNITLEDQYWDTHLEVECFDKMSSLLSGNSPKCIDVNIGRKPEGRQQYENYGVVEVPVLEVLTPSQPKYLCEPKVSKGNWKGDEDYADTFSILQGHNIYKHNFDLEVYHHAQCGAENWANIDLTVQCCTPGANPDPILITGTGTCPTQCLNTKSGVGVWEGGTEAPGGLCMDFAHDGHCAQNAYFEHRGSDCRDCQVCEEVDVGAYPLEIVPDYTPECSQEGMLGWRYSHKGIWAGYKYHGAAYFDECLDVCDKDEECMGFSIYRPQGEDTEGSCYLYPQLGTTEIQEHGLQLAYAKCIKGRVSKVLTISEGLTCPSTVKSLGGESFNITHEHIEDEDGNVFRKVPNTINVNNAGDDVVKFNWNDGFSVRCCKVKSKKDEDGNEVALPNQVATSYELRPTCPTTIFATVANNAPPLCRDLGAATITYIGESCGDRKIIWNKMIAYAANGNPVDMNRCAWSAEGKDKGWRDAYTGSCGVAPAVAGISGLPTSCTEL